jgi:serine protease Do
VASLITALAGIPLFGLVTGLVAVVMACFALVGIYHSSGRSKGLGFAFAGLGTGLAVAAGWLLFLSFSMGRGGAARPGGDAQTIELDDLQELQKNQPAVARAMRANVMIRHAAWMGEASGSGVVLRLDDGEALIVTNRHVLDNDFPERTDPPDLEKLSSKSLRVSMIGSEAQPARVVWVAPDGVDLALLKVKVDGAQIQPAPWEPNHPIQVGRRVFAIGNPYQLGWTYTDGVVSQLRSMRFGRRKLRIIQTQASVNPGNSGGGLYDEKGMLIGIVTWTHDKSTSEGLGFAINLDVLIELAPDDLLKPGIPYLSAQPES